MKSKTTKGQQKTSEQHKSSKSFKGLDHKKSIQIVQKQQKSPPKSKQSPSRLSNSPSKKVKTAGPEVIQQLAEKHYNKAMKYVYKKNNVHAQMIKRQAQKSRFDKQKLSEEHTFQPILRDNPYNKKIELMKGNKSNNKVDELRKWGINHQANRRENVIKGEIQNIRSSLQKQQRSLQNSRKFSLDRSSLEKVRGATQNVIKPTERVVDKIPGVRKFYLNQARAQVSKGSKQRLMFRGNQTSGYFF